MPYGFTDPSAYTANSSLTPYQQQQAHNGYANQNQQSGGNQQVLNLINQAYQSAQQAKQQNQAALAQATGLLGSASQQYGAQGDWARWLSGYMPSYGSGGGQASGGQQSYGALPYGAGRKSGPASPYDASSRAVMNSQGVNINPQNQYGVATYAGNPASEAIAAAQRAASPGGVQTAGGVGGIPGNQGWVMNDPNQYARAAQADLAANADLVQRRGQGSLAQMLSGNAQAMANTRMAQMQDLTGRQMQGANLAAQSQQQGAQFTSQLANMLGNVQYQGDDLSPLIQYYQSLGSQGQQQASVPAFQMGPGTTGQSYYPKDQSYAGAPGELTSSFFMNPGAYGM